MEFTTTDTTTVTKKKSVSLSPEFLTKFQELQQFQRTSGIPVTSWTEFLSWAEFFGNETRNEETAGTPPNVPETPGAAAGDNPAQTATVNPVLPVTGQPPRRGGPRAPRGGRGRGRGQGRGPVGGQQAPAEAEDNVPPTGPRRSKRLKEKRDSAK